MDCYGKKAGKGALIQEELSGTLGVSQDQYLFCEYHPNDSRIKIDESGSCQTLTGRMGTGGGNVPIVISVDFSHADDVVRIGGAIPTLTNRTHKGGNCVLYKK